MRNCSVCGAELPDGAAACPVCGCETGPTAAPPPVAIVTAPSERKNRVRKFENELEKRKKIMNVFASSDVSLEEVDKAASIVEQEADDDANIIFGVAFDDTLEDEIRITLIATGFDEGNSEYDPEGTAIPQSVEKKAAPAEPDVILENSDPTIRIDKPGSAAAEPAGPAKTQEDDDNDMEKLFKFFNGQ